MKIIIKTILGLIVTILIILAIGFLDAQNFDNFLYQNINSGPLNYYDLRIWDFFIAIGTVLTALVTVIALWLTYKTGIFDKTPDVLASGTFIISTKNEDTNKTRDEAIKNSSIHTLQLINVGRGLAKNIIPSVRKEVIGNFLEDINPHAYTLASGKSTRDLGEILRVHGQRFVKENKHALKFKEDRKTACFYIYFEDYTNNSKMTEVKIGKVDNADGDLGKLLKTDGIEVWKVIENTTEEI
ncbi:MAG: hypothetical protein Q8P92_04400 [Candidatus Daviesbacteria bacterium]|nr:hypothetical protein [Candidatus Daviesbacteria bacterium]